MKSSFATLILNGLLPIIRSKRKVCQDRNIIILCYHRIRNDTGTFYDQNISASREEFEKQMLYVSKRFNVISVDELIDYCSGKSDIEPNSIMLTFDDGYQDGALNAFPVLERFKIPAIVFITTGFIDSDDIPWEDKVAYIFNTAQSETLEVSDGEVYSSDDKENSIWRFCKKLKPILPAKRNEIIESVLSKYNVDKTKMKSVADSLSMGFMTNNDIRYWNARGIDFGIHTVTHPCLTTLTEEEMYIEVQESREALEAILKKQVDAFAYPYGRLGDFDKITRSVLEKAGITIGMVFEPGINYPDTDFLELRRFGIGENVNFKLACHGFVSHSGLFQEIIN